MAYGGIIYNSDGDVVFNTSDEVFQIIGKGTLTLTTFSSSVTKDNITTNPYYYSGNMPKQTLGRYGRKWKQNAIGPWDDGVLTLFEVNNGDQVFKFEDYLNSNGNKYMFVWKYGSNSSGSTTTVRYVQVRRASELTAPTGYGMAFYNANGDVTWSSETPVLDNVLPLSVTNTTNRWFYWQGEYVAMRGYPAGYKHYRGIKGNASSFTPQASSMGYYGVAAAAFRDRRLGGNYNRAHVGFSANIDWNEI